ncbi:transporter substrate-binding domain-containing protein [Gemella sp. GH3]|uniref:transporter substrate-binding domain-containing protein n=1 Tax=unclassified Gemella TaxID=2624949 RepID=UPI0015D0A5F6|nr:MULTISPECIES: transporter substrate-binding domain-containing protein [unclassified Gemella]MBF0713857.1 transporter substrate-binding domain-containing protein [Gemella sp. GH3.1]NYS50809.1 transporter substrate-binding domain-containing protein [Gemella sp. GH3]
MKKIFTFLLSIFLITMVVGCSKDNTNKLDKIKSKGKITLAVSPDYPPYEFFISDNGEVKVVGADIYLAEEIAKKLDVELEIVQLSFDSLLPALTSGRVDMVISGMNPSEERRKVVDFSKNYYVGGSAFIVNKSNEDIKSLDDLKNKKIAVQKGSIQEKYLLDELGLDRNNIQSLSDVPNLLQDLKNGNADAVFLAEDVSKIALKKENTLTLSNFILEKDAESDGLAIAFKKGNNDTLLLEVNKVVEELVENNKFEEQLIKYGELVARY